MIASYMEVAILMGILVGATEGARISHKLRETSESDVAISQQSMGASQGEKWWVAFGAPGRFPFGDGGGRSRDDSHPSGHTTTTSIMTTATSTTTTTEASYSFLRFVPELSPGCKFANDNCTLVGQWPTYKHPANFARGTLFPRRGIHSYSVRLDSGCHHDGSSDDIYIGVVSESKGKNLQDKYNLKGAWLWKVEYGEKSVFSADGEEAGESSHLPQDGDIITVETDMDSGLVNFKWNGEPVKSLVHQEIDLQPAVLAFYSKTTLTLV